VINSNWHPIS